MIVVLTRPRRPITICAVARRREQRRFGPGPFLTGLRPDPSRWGRGFPFDVPAVAAVQDLHFDQPVTLLAGENGSGKSTIIEALAEAIGFAPEGGERERAGRRPQARAGAFVRVHPIVE